MDHYSTLGVSRNASQEEIKKAYRKLAMTHHPDKGGNPAEFQKLNDAYEVLSNTDKKLQYDNPSARPNNPFGGDFQFDQNNFDLSNIFNHIFGGGRGPQAGFNQKQVFRTQVSVSLVDVYNSKEHSLQLSTPTGVKVINVKVPSGINHGDQVRYENVIDNGTLIIVFHIMPDLRFDRNGNDLYCNLPISVLDLIIGTKVKFTSIAGKTIEVTIPPNTQPSHQIRLPGLGMPIKNSPNIYGDQILLLKPYLPDNISSDVIESIQRNQVNN
jgi:curved DNA-binding protein